MAVAGEKVGYRRSGPNSTSVTVKKKLSDQLIEDLKIHDSSDDSNGGSFENQDDANISFGTKNWNEAFQIHNESELDQNLYFLDYIGRDNIRFIQFILI